MNVTEFLSHCSVDTCVAIVNDVMHQVGADPDAGLIVMSVGERIGSSPNADDRTAFLTMLSQWEPPPGIVRLLVESITSKNA
jgi:hypothetical protein